MAQTNIGANKIKKVFIGSTKVKAAYVGSTRVFASEIEVTDLVKWYSWSASGHTAGVNSAGEGPASYLNGITVYSSASSAGSAKGTISQNINMVNGHKYWQYAGTYSSDNACRLTTPFGTYGQGTFNSVYTYTGTSGSKNVNFTYVGSDDAASQYSKLSCLNIVDLTAAFGAGEEPTAAWCASNLGIFNGTKTVEV